MDFQRSLEHSVGVLEASGVGGGGGGGEGGEATRSGTEKRCYHNLQSDPLGSGFEKGRENFPL